jgi:DNA-binding response OmpR family regulator
MTTQTSFLRKKKILVVEDQADYLELLRSYFKDEGFAIATAKNGVDALRKARSLLPDLILLDVMLPEMNGFAVCETLRKDQATATIPVLMLTGLCSQLARGAGIDAGATDFVTKPVTPDEIVSRVKGMLLKQMGTTTVTSQPQRPN